MASIHFHHALAATLAAADDTAGQHQLLLQAGINPKLSARANKRVTDLQMSRLVQSVWQQTQDEFMGFTQQRCKPGSFAFMLNTISGQSNLLSALTTGIQFYNLVTDDIATQIYRAEDKLVIEFAFAQPQLDPQHFFHEFWFVIWHRLSCYLTGIQLPLQAVHFSYPKPDHAYELNLMFPCQLHFGCSANKLVFDETYGQAELVRSKQDIKQFLRRSPLDLLTIPGLNTSLANRVKQVFIKVHSETRELPNLNQTCEALNLTASTLHRRLSKEGASFQNLKDDFRKELSIDLLLKQQLPVQEIAEQVGFADARSLTRAFKLWTGSTPRKYSQLYKNRKQKN